LIADKIRFCGTALRALLIKGKKIFKQEFS